MTGRRLKPIKRKRSGGARRGRTNDKPYLCWLAQQPGVVHGGITHSIHHIRYYGSPKNDRHTLPMEFGYHQIQEGPQSIEALGKPKWCALHRINIEERIAEYQQRYLSEHPDIVW